MSRVSQTVFSRVQGRDEPAPAAAGVTRFDLICNARIPISVPGLARRWAEDRALSPEAVHRLVMLVRAAMEHGLRFDPRGLTMTLRWRDVDRVRIDVWWEGCRSTARRGVNDGDLESTAAALDVLAEDWGFATSRSGPVQWMVNDTRSAPTMP